jgi:hypothetical protein
MFYMGAWTGPDTDHDAVALDALTSLAARNRMDHREQKDH